jgi:adenylate cyclase
VPLVYNDRTLGIITLAHEQPGHYDQEHLRLLETLAGFAALALEHARMHDATDAALAAQAELESRPYQAESAQAAPAWDQVAGYIPPPLVDALVCGDPAGLAQLEQPLIRDIIVVFADMRGLVDSGHRIRLETLVGEVLDSYYQIATECIVRWGGYVDKFLGGMIMAIFGYPARQPDDARRALRAALELRRVTARMRTYWRARLGLHTSMAIGIAYGRAAIGGIGPRQRRDYTAIGDAVDIAARLRELARTGEILVAAEVIEALDQPAGTFILEALQPLQLHSNARPQQIYRVDEPQNSAASYGNTYDIYRNDTRRGAHRRADAHLTGD